MFGEGRVRNLVDGVLAAVFVVGTGVVVWCVVVPEQGLSLRIHVLKPVFDPRRLLLALGDPMSDDDDSTAIGIRELVLEHRFDHGIRLGSYPKIPSSHSFVIALSRGDEDANTHARPRSPQPTEPTSNPPWIAASPRPCVRVAVSEADPPPRVPPRTLPGEWIDATRQPTVRLVLVGTDLLQRIPVDVEKSEVRLDGLPAQVGVFL